MKQKSFHKGIEQLVQEGAIQLYKTYHTGEYILGAVGQLQFEVFQYRLLNEYNAEVILTPLEARLPDGLTKNNWIQICHQVETYYVATVLTNQSSYSKTNLP